MTGVDYRLRVAVNTALTRLVERRYDPKLKMSDAFAGLPYSEQHLRPALTQRLGMSPWRYVVEMRLHRACELLATTDQTVAAIGLAVGYQHPTSLWHAFRERYGVSPRAYRRRVRAGRVSAGASATRSEETRSVRTGNQG